MDAIIAEEEAKLSADQYPRLERRDRRVFRTEDMPQEWIDAIMAAEPPDEAKQFDHEVRTLIPPP
jgi:hypothetical protein